MNKLLKRFLMLGMLIGCMATAALAGNVETDWLDGNTDSDVNIAAEGYYQTSQSYTNRWATTPQPVVTYDFYFNTDGSMTWGKCNTSDGYIIYRNDYDANGNLIKTVNTTSAYDNEVMTETYTYDNDGLLTQSHLDSSYKNGSEIMDYTYTYTYGDHQVTVDAVYKDSEGTTTRTYVYTLDDEDNVLKCVSTSPQGVTLTNVYTYDVRGNLVSNENVGSGKYVFEYNDKDLCTKKTWVDASGSTFATTYEYDENGNVVKQTDGSGNTYSNTYDKIPVGGSVSAFEDVKATDYYNAPVIWAGENGITTGVNAKEFCPGNPCTRAQLVTFLWRAAGSPDPKDSTNPFTDVDTKAYYYKAVLWAVENGVTKGTSADKFSPNAQCTRGQIVTFIYRAAGEPEVESAGSTFTDVNPKAYYAKAVLWAVKNGITNGYANGEFRPDNTCTRAQGVTFLYRGIGLY